MSGVTFGSTDKIIEALNKTDQALLEEIDKLGTNPDQSALLGLQRSFQKWTTFVQMVTTINKELADTLKGILQKV